MREVSREELETRRAEALRQLAFVRANPEHELVQEIEEIDFLLHGPGKRDGCPTD